MEKRDLVIVGSGGLAREIKWIVEEINDNLRCWNNIGWVSTEQAGTVIDGLPVLGDDEWLLRYGHELDVVIGVGSGALRKTIVSRIQNNRNLSFPRILSHSAEISPSVKLGAGSIIAAKSVLTVGIETGDFFFCNLACTVGHDCKFGNYVTLNPGAHISGNVTLGECVTVGTGASIIQGLTVGRDSFIGAGAAVANSVGEGIIAVGVPAKPLRKRGSIRELE